MRSSRLWLVLLTACSSQAFQDASPLLYFSTAEHILSSPQVASSASLLSSIDFQLLTRGEGSSCPMHTYIVAVQPGVSSHDFTFQGTSPNLQKWLSANQNDYKSAFAVPEVIGDKTPDELIQLISSRCSREPIRTNFQSVQRIAASQTDHEPRLIVIDMPSLPNSKDRRTTLMNNDMQLASSIQSFFKHDFALFYATTPAQQDSLLPDGEPPSYTMDESQDSLHLELKRDLSAYRRDQNVTLVDGPLFEKYQYLTPGLFMGLLTIIFILMIGYIGVNALASLQVSYAAFDKENGPQGQRHKAQ